jgi:hypothetical protein
MLELPIMYVFVDSTEYKRFLAPEPDIKTLKTLKSLLGIKSKKGRLKAILIITDQVIDEYYRAESQRISESREQHAKKNFLLSFDRLGKEESIEEKRINKKAGELKSSFEKLRNIKIKEFDKKMTETKNLIREIFALAKKIDCNDQIFRKVEIRTARSMHPRRSKEGSVGDAINWEIILSTPDDRDFVIVTQDGDFIEKNSSDLHTTLRDEWCKNHTKKIKVVPYVGNFIDLIHKTEKNVIKKQVKKKKVTKKLASKNSSKDNTPSPGTSTYVARSAPLSLSENPIVFPNPDILEVPRDNSISRILPRVTWNQNGEDPVSCPFCQANKDKLIEHFPVVYGSKVKNYFCLNCGKEFSV